MSIEITQTAQFKIKELSISSKFGKIDVGGIFDELNIFDTMLMPCMSGNIVIRDAIGLSQKLYFDGSELINIDISKSDESLAVTNMKKTFRIYKQSDRKNIKFGKFLLFKEREASQLRESKGDNKGIIKS